MTRLSQAQLVLNALKSGPKTIWQLTEGLRISRPGARIFELKKTHEITDEWKEVHGRRVKVYAYQGPKSEQASAPCVPLRSQGMYRRTCAECGTRFDSNRKHAKFCGTTCRTAAWKRNQILEPIEAQQSLEFCSERLRSERERTA